MNLNTETGKKAHASILQLRYARILSYGVRAAFAVMVVTFALYVFDIVPPHVSMSQLVTYLHEPAEAYTEGADVPQNWGWVLLLPASDFLNFIGIILLTALTIIAILILLPSFIKRKDWAYAVIVTVELLVLLTAASGLLNV